MPAQPVTPAGSPTVSDERALPLRPENAAVNASLNQPVNAPANDPFIESVVDAMMVDDALPVQEFFEARPPLAPQSTHGTASGPTPTMAPPPPGTTGYLPVGSPFAPGSSAAGGSAYTSSAGSATTQPVKHADWAKRMLVALLDPHAILWFLTLGGGLSILGLVIWLTSLGLFKNPLVVAGCLGAGSLATLALGCGVALRTRFVTAGKALSFLSCVVLPLNLWYYESQGILTVDGNLWVAAFVICWLYIGVVYVLRDALFLYAVEAGVTLTTLLTMASLGRLSDVTYLSLALVVLGLVSIHGERAFPPDATVFARKRFGMALFWCGQAQLAAGLGFLLAAQLIRDFIQPVDALFAIRWTGVPLTDWKWLAAGAWLAGAYAWIYSDIVVRRLGFYTYLAGASLTLAGVTVVGLDVATETLILLLSGAAVAAAVMGGYLPAVDDRYRRALRPASMLFGFLAVALGAVLHLRATSRAIEAFDWSRETDWYFVFALAIAAAANRLLVVLPRARDQQAMSAHLFLSAGALVIGAAGLLRQMNLCRWQEQAPLLMAIPVIYLLVSRLSMERGVRDPLQWISHTATAVIMGSIFLGSFTLVGRVLLPVSGDIDNLLAGVVFAEALLFYSLAAWIRRQAANYYLATIAGCAMAWEWLGYAQVPSEYYTLLYALLGVLMLGVARGVGVSNETVYDTAQRPLTRLLGPGRPLYLVANGLIAMAVVAAVLQSLARLLFRDSGTEQLLVLVCTTGAGGLATVLSRRGPERWWHATGTTVLAILTLLTFNVLLDMELWRKAELAASVLGIAMLVAGLIAHFRADDVDELASLGVWLGSLLATLALSAAVFFQGIMVSPPDDLALLTVTIVMVACGAGLKFKAPTLLGGASLGIYVATVIIDLAYSPQVAVGIYLAVGGLAIFLTGVVLSMCRERLLVLPEQLAKREGVFKVFDWR
jgi:hypothetical protein